MAYSPRTKEEKAPQEDKVIQESSPTRKRERIPFGIPRSKLSVSLHPEGYHLHWVNDDGPRVHQAQEGGYEFCTHDEVGLPNDLNETRVKRVVGKTENGEALFAYLMKIRQEWYEEDQHELQSGVDRVENAIKSGTFEENAQDLRYVPKQGIKIR